MSHWRWAVLAVVLLLHAGAVAALRPEPRATAPAVTPPVLEVSLIAEVTPAPATPQPAAEPMPKPAPAKTAPRPKPVSRPAPTSPEPAVAQPTPAAPAEGAPAIANSQAPAAGANAPSPPIREPAAISCRPPAYPAEARRRRETGTVLLRLLVDVGGDVVDRRIEQSSGFEALDEAALTALSRCKFTPGTVGGHVQPAWARLRYVWKLE